MPICLAAADAAIIGCVKTYMLCSLFLLFCSDYCKDVFCYPEFKPFLVKIMAGPINSMWLDDEICHELWYEGEFRVVITIMVIWLYFCLIVNKVIALMTKIM
jgi:hypothetical protein